MPVLVADNELVGVDCLAPPGFRIERYSGRQIPEALIAEADALYVRSTVALSQVTWPAQLAFVGTATIGTDHLPLEALRAHGIQVASAPGCNALAVTDYVLATIAGWAFAHQRSLAGLRLGIVGYGQIGRRLAHRAEQLGIAVHVNDPPAAERGHCPQHQALDALVPTVDVLTLHTPLVDADPWPSRHLLSADRLAPMPSGGLVINAARGALVASDCIAARPDLDWALDVFPDEPWVSETLLDQLWQATPHIAGHSLAGKWRGTQMIAAAHRRMLGLPPSDAIIEGVSTAAKADWSAIQAVVGVAAEDQRFRQALAGVAEPAARMATFDRVRQSYPLRAESVRDCDLGREQIG